MPELRVTFTFEPDDVRLEESAIGVVVHLRNSRTAGEPGSPALPQCIVRVALPPRARLIGVDAHSSGIMMLGTSVVPVAPLQLCPNLPVVPANPMLYEEAMCRPVAHVVHAASAAIGLSPVRLTPDARLELVTRIDVIVRYARSAGYSFNSRTSSIVRMSALTPLATRNSSS